MGSEKYREWDATKEYNSSMVVKYRGELYIAQPVLFDQTFNGFVGNINKNPLEPDSRYWIDYKPEKEFTMCHSEKTVIGGKVVSFQVHEDRLYVAKEQGVFVLDGGKLVPVEFVYDPRYSERINA